MCDCIEDMNARLAEKNGKLAITIGLQFGGGASQALPTIEVEKINKRGKTPPIAVPTFCPFCGARYSGCSQVEV